jgi:uncharacterized protein
MRSIIAAIIVMSLSASVLAEPNLTGTATELSNYLANIPQTVAVTGKAEIKVPADRAVIQLKVTTDEKSLQGAMKKNQTIRSDIKASLVAGGIAEDRIKGSRFSSTPRTGLWSEKVKSYKVENGITVSVASEDEFQLVAGELDKHPELSYQGMSFERSDKTQLKQQAIAQACEAAMAKKQLFEDKLGVKLTTVGFAQPDSVVIVAGLGRRTTLGLAANVSSAPASPAEGDEEAGISQFDEMTFVAEVTLECRLGPRGKQVQAEMPPTPMGKRQ